MSLSRPGGGVSWRSDREMSLARGTTWAAGAWCEHGRHGGRGRSVHQIRKAGPCPRPVRPGLRLVKVPRCRAALRLPVHGARCPAGARRRAARAAEAGLRRHVPARSRRLGRAPAAAVPACAGPAADRRRAHGRGPDGRAGRGDRGSPGGRAAGTAAGPADHGSRPGAHRGAWARCCAAISGPGCCASSRRGPRPRVVEMTIVVTFGAAIAGPGAALRARGRPPGPAGRASAPGALAVHRHRDGLTTGRRASAGRRGSA